MFVQKIDLGGCRSRGRSPRRVGGFTLIELLVVVAIISLLVSILLPSLNKARELAKAAVCGAELHQIGIGYLVYVDDNGGKVPVEGNWPVPPWPVQMGPYLGVPAGELTGKLYPILTCPASGMVPEQGYYWNSTYGANISSAFKADWMPGIKANYADTRFPTDVIVMIDYIPGFRWVKWMEMLEFNTTYRTRNFRHPGEKAIAVMMDGHVESFPHPIYVRQTQFQSEPPWRSY